MVSCEGKCIPSQLFLTIKIAYRSVFFLSVKLNVVVFFLSLFVCCFVFFICLFLILSYVI